MAKSLVMYGWLVEYEQVQDKMEILEHQHLQIKVVKVVMEYKIAF